MTPCVDTVRSALRLDLTTLARLCVQASSLRTVEELSDFATRTLGRMLGLDCAQIALGDEGRPRRRRFWRRPDSELAATDRARARRELGEPHRRRLGIQRRRRHRRWHRHASGPRKACCVAPAPRRRRAGRHTRRPHASMPVLDGEQTEAATLLTQQTAALIDVAQALRRERRAAVTDSLTGLLNRRGFDERLREEIGRATRTRRPLALVLADCDDSSASTTAPVTRPAIACSRRSQRPARAEADHGHRGPPRRRRVRPAATRDRARTPRRGRRTAARAALRSLTGTPITASIGVAVFPADGATSSALLRRGRPRALRREARRQEPISATTASRDRPARVLAATGESAGRDPPTARRGATRRPARVRPRAHADGRGASSSTAPSITA